MVEASALPVAAPGFTLVAVDDDLVVLNKPAHLLSVPGKGPAGADCLSARAQAVYPDARVVHRLDMGTSGLLVMARGAANQRTLSQAFALRQTHKRYEAVLAGQLTESGHTMDPEGWCHVDLPLITDWPNRPRSKVCHEQGKPSLTRWRVLGTGPLPNTTRVLLEPVTGRSHQLRVHMLALGHPMVGDALYASGPALAAANRLLLHACMLSLPHPATGERVEWNAPTPF